MQEKKQNREAAHAKAAASKSTAGNAASKGDALPAEELRMAALAMTELANSLHELVNFLQVNPEIRELPAAMRELSKRISVLSTRL